MRATYLEIYQEEVRDLLGKNPQQRLELKESVDRGVYVKGLMQFVVKGMAEINSVLQVGTSCGGRRQSTQPAWLSLLSGCRPIRKRSMQPGCSASPSQLPALSQCIAHPAWLSLCMPPFADAALSQSDPRGLPCLMPCCL